MTGEHVSSSHCFFYQKKRDVMFWRYYCFVEYRPIYLEVQRENEIFVPFGVGPMVRFM